MGSDGKITNGERPERAHYDDHAVRSHNAAGLPYREVLLETLNRIGCGGVVLDSNQTVIATNSITIEILNRRTGELTQNGGCSIDKVIQNLLNQVSLPVAENDWATAWQNTENPLAVIRIPSESETVLVLVDIGSRLQPSKGALRRMFGLTSAESKLALGLASGSSPDEFARQIGVRKTTVRTQLASVFSKTQTSRQGELIALLARVSILP